MTNAPQNPQYPQDGNRYGTTGYNPNQSFEMSKPPKVDRLFQMTLASLAIYVISGLLGLFAAFSAEGREAARAELEGQDLGGMSVDQAITAGVVVAVVIALVILLVAVIGYVLVLLGIKKRWGWSRIFGIVLAILGIIFTLIGLFSGGSAVMVILNVLLGLAFIAVNVYWLILAFNGQVAAWMSRRA